MIVSSRLSTALSPRTRAASSSRSTLPPAVVPGNAASIAAAPFPSYRRWTTASASCTGTPSSAKNRAVVDFPMPSEPVRPRMNMPPPYPKRSDNSPSQPAGLTQIVQERHERQPKNDEMVAFDAVEKVDPEPLKLVAADACRQSGSRGVEIGFKELIRKGAHAEPRNRTVFP